MFSSIDQNEVLFWIIRHYCDENNISANLCSELCDGDGEPNYERIRILKVDEYYSARYMHNPPPSVDCLVIVKCEDGYYFFFVELRNVCHLDAIRRTEIVPKFNTMTKFCEDSPFSGIVGEFYEEIVDVKCILLSYPFNGNCPDEETFYKRARGTVLELYQLERPIMIAGHMATIEPRWPGMEICCPQ